ncbi:TetR/AcrR family transcriptional regulator [Mycoplasmatota bacterium]|nr:TetR/AcrR family transcriptional regulator [Mycoplasmatota bacterium]
MEKQNYNQKEIILSVAKQIALEQGMSRINIRLVAKKSNISIGTVYNNYTTKADLIVAVIEDFWIEAYKKIDLTNLIDKNFYEKIEEVYNTLSTYLQNFKDNWLDQIVQLSSQEKQLGRKKQEEYFGKIRNMIVTFIDNDTSISDNIWVDGISKEKTAKFISDNMLIMLKNNEEDLSFFISLLKKIITD